MQFNPDFLVTSAYEQLNDLITSLEDPNSVLALRRINRANTLRSGPKSRTSSTSNRRKLSFIQGSEDFAMNALPASITVRARNQFMGIDMSLYVKYFESYEELTQDISILNQVCRNILEREFKKMKTTSALSVHSEYTDLLERLVEFEKTQYSIPNKLKISTESPSSPKLQFERHPEVTRTSPWINETKELIQVLSKPLPEKMYITLENWVATVVESATKVVSLNSPPENRVFKPEPFVSELEVFSQRLLLGIGWISIDANKRIVLAFWKKCLSSVLELLEAHCETEKPDVLKKFHLRVKNDFRKTLEIFKNHVIQAASETKPRRRNSFVSEYKPRRATEYKRDRSKSLLSAHRSPNKEFYLGSETAYGLSFILDELQVNGVPPEVDALAGFGHNKGEDFVNLSEHISKLSNQLIVVVSTLEPFAFEDFQVMLVHTANLARGVSVLPYTNKVLGELLVGYVSTLVKNGIQFSGLVSRVLGQNPMDLSLALPRKAILDALSCVLDTIRECFKSRCSRCDRPIQGGFFKIEQLNVCGNCFRCFTCDKPLEVYCEEEGKLYCETHYNRMLQNSGLVCETCQQIISGTYMELDQHIYHPECVCCCKCKVVLEEIYEINGKMFCGSCEY